MAAKDVFHDAVRHALEKEQWIVTNDSFFSLELPRRLVERYRVKLIVYEPEEAEIVRWQKNESNA